MRCTNDSHRRAFTMLELMVVIALITLLLGMLTGAMWGMVVSAREHATATTIAKVDKILQERVAGFRQMDFSDAALQYQASWNLNYALTPGYQIGSSQLAEIIVRKYRMKSSFPQNLTEVYSNGVIDPRYTSLGSLSPGTNSFESGIVLYALLQYGETFGAPSVGTDTFSSSEVRTSVETGGLPCLVDAWGKPLRFYRWPTRLIRTGLATANGSGIDRTYATFLMSNIGRANGYGADGIPQAANATCTQGAYGSDDVPNCGPDGAPGVLAISPNVVASLGTPGSDDYEPLNVDPDDPLLLLYNPVLQLLATPTFLTSGLVTTTIFEQGNTTNVVYWPALHTPNTYHPFLIVSAGPDGNLGLYEPTVYPSAANPSAFGYLAAPDLTSGLTIQYLLDNISNLNLTGSGK